VKVKLNGTELSIGVDYTVEGNTLTLYRSTTTSDSIYVYRKTETNRLVQFNDGSVLREVDLTTLQLQLLHVIEEQGTFTITTVKEETKQLQFERDVTVAAGVNCKRGTLLGYKAGGYVLADNTDYTSLQGLVLALGEPTDNKVHVLARGAYATNEFDDGKTCFVGTNGAVVTAYPNVSGNYVKVIGFMEGNTLQFQPDSIAIQLT
jgi:hypothetical protein